jgi:hypothetical protein
MARWDNAANNAMVELKASTGVSDTDMAALKSAIENWFTNNPGSQSHNFPFTPVTRFRHHSLTAHFANGWITNITYGDN